MRTIHNTTFIVNPEIEDEWIKFVNKDYVSMLAQHNIVKDIIFSKVSIDQPEGNTYSLQIVFHDKDVPQQFYDELLPYFEGKLLQHYKDRYLCFSSLLHEL
ncbi:MAG: DUF4286 family protein [Culturomica sp.]|jgi:hypothetical protein|nr:DUF4286 family protein [Culturomica sp.]